MIKPSVFVFGINLFFLITHVPAIAHYKSSVLQYVNPLIGTSSSTTLSALNHASGTEQSGNTIPAVSPPFAMTQWTPQTRRSEQKCLAPYYYKDSVLSGIRGSHWLSGSCTQDYGSFTVMPVTGSVSDLLQQDFVSSFSHKNEKSAPHFYEVRLNRYHLQVAVTATPHCGILKITSEQDALLSLLVLPNSDRGKAFIKYDAIRREIVGYNPVYRIYQSNGQPAGISGYFVIQLPENIVANGVFSERQLFSGDSIVNVPNMGAYVSLTIKKGGDCIIRCGTSFTSIEEARLNLNAEVKNKSFESIKAQTALAWEAALQKIKVETVSTRNKKIFYTALYHTMQQPRLFTDVSGSYPVFSKQYTTGKLSKGTYYDDFSQWDIYRAALPLHQLLNPKLINSFVNSMLLKGQAGGWLPIFPCWNNYTNAMIGDHVIPFIVSAYAHNIRDYSVPQAYRLMRQNAFEIPPDSVYLQGKGRRALKSYLQYGYIPLEDSIKDSFHRMEQVSRTMEYAYDDYALAQTAKALGYTEDYQELMKRSENYIHVFDKQQGIVNGKKKDGSWVDGYHPDEKRTYITEGTPRQYTFYVPHNIPGLINLLGGEKSFEYALDSLFYKKQYWHGNEPGQQIPFLYNFTASAWKTQKEVRKILEEEYSEDPGGLSGNDDAGQISAWYVFAAIGLYPIDPVSAKYELASPLFDRISIQSGMGKQFQIITNRQSPASMYISKMTLNNKAYRLHSLSYHDMIKGGTLKIWLQDKPDTLWMK